MSTTPRTRWAQALLVSIVLLVGATGCGGSDGDDATATTAAEGSADATEGASSGEGEAGASDDPCQWYSAADMEALLGFPVTVEDRSVGETATCLYDAPDVYSSVEISITTPDQDAANKAAAEAPAMVDVAGEVITVDGVGDSAWGHSSPGGADIGAVKGDRAVGVLVTTGAARDGEGSGNLATAAATLEVAKQIATEALG